MSRTNLDLFKKKKLLGAETKSVPPQKNPKNSTKNPKEIHIPKQKKKYSIFLTATRENCRGNIPNSVDFYGTLHALQRTIF